MPNFHTLTFLLVAALPACTGNSSAPAATSDPGDIAFNEMHASGDEWLELYNAGDHDVDLAGYGVTDTDKTTGAPRTTKAMRFPSGTVLEREGFLLVLLGKKNSTPGPYSSDACLPDVSAGCFYALFSISETRGESIHLLAADNKALSSAIYPADLAFDAGNLTACRIPDGEGGFIACRGTPAASNKAQ
jgi:hypothetical protein